MPATIRVTEMLQERMSNRNSKTAVARRADPQHTIAELKSALKESAKEERAGEGKRFRNRRHAMRGLEG